MATDTDLADLDTGLTPTSCSSGALLGHQSLQADPQGLRQAGHRLPGGAASPTLQEGDGTLIDAAPGSQLGLAEARFHPQGPQVSGQALPGPGAQALSLPKIWRSCASLMFLPHGRAVRRARPTAASPSRPRLLANPARHPASDPRSRPASLPRRKTWPPSRLPPPSPSAAAAARARTPTARSPTPTAAAASAPTPAVAAAAPPPPPARPATAPDAPPRAVADALPGSPLSTPCATPQ